jgi:hypothetical protein
MKATDALCAARIVEQSPPEELLSLKTWITLSRGVDAPPSALG